MFAIQFLTKVQNFNLLKHIIDRSSNWLINDLMMQYWQGGWSTADIPVERLVGPGVKIDISKQVQS